MVVRGKEENKTEKFKQNKQQQQKAKFYLVYIFKLNLFTTKHIMMIYYGLIIFTLLKQTNFYVKKHPVFLNFLFCGLV